MLSQVNLARPRKELTYSAIVKHHLPPLHPLFFGVTGVAGVTFLIYMNIFSVTGVAYGVTGNTVAVQALPKRRKCRAEGSFPACLTAAVLGFVGGEVR